MKTTKIDEIEDLADGVPVLVVEGAVKYASEIKSGTTGKTDWSRQFFVLTSGTAEVGCTLWDAEGNAMKKGESVRIENTQDKKGHWTGITKGSYSKEGKLNHALEIRAEKVKITHPNGQDESAFQQTKAAMQPRFGVSPPGTVDAPSSAFTPDNEPQSPPPRQKDEDRTRQWVSGPMSKDDYWRRKEDRDEERQKLIVRQHSQSSAIEILKLKVTLNELTIEDLMPSKIKALADFFDADVFTSVQQPKDP